MKYLIERISNGWLFWPNVGHEVGYDTGIVYCRTLRAASEAVERYHRINDVPGDDTIPINSVVKS